MSSIERSMLSLAIKAECRIKHACRKIAEKLNENTANTYLDTLIKMLIAVVLGVALLAALKTFILDKFFPELETQIMDMFSDTSGGGSGGGGGASVTT